MATTQSEMMLAGLVSWIWSKMVCARRCDGFGRLKGEDIVLGVCFQKKKGFGVTKKSTANKTPLNASPCTGANPFM